MIYHQADFLTNRVRIEGVKLCIASVPLSILDTETGLLFGLLNRMMRPDGWIVIDAPKGYNQRRINLWHGASASGWTQYRHHVIKDMYHQGEDQILYVYRKQCQTVGLNTPLTVERHREKGHPCEFCPVLISELIQTYSEPGDVVLDAFCGTGTVPGEADRLGRYGIGIDIRPVANIRKEYCVGKL